jgi:hypothetical protein
MNIHVQIIFDNICSFWEEGTTAVFLTHLEKNILVAVKNWWSLTYGQVYMSCRSVLLVEETGVNYQSVLSR